jgi:hypothetical protein
MLREWGHASSARGRIRRRKEGEGRRQKKGRRRQKAQGRRQKEDNPLGRLLTIGKTERRSRQNELAARSNKRKVPPRGRRPGLSYDARGTEQVFRDIPVHPESSVRTDGMHFRTNPGPEMRVGICTGHVLVRSAVGPYLGTWMSTDGQFHLASRVGMRLFLLSSQLHRKCISDTTSRKMHIYASVLSPVNTYGEMHYASVLPLPYIRREMHMHHSGLTSVALMQEVLANREQR